MKKTILICLIAFYFCANQFAQQIIPVSTTQGLISAKQSLRNGNESAIVELSNGIYFLDDTMVFNEADGRSDMNYITYRAASGANPIISGGYLVTGVWEQVPGKSYYKTTIPSGVGTEGLEYTRNLYVNGERATRASSGNVRVRGTFGPPIQGFRVTRSLLPVFAKPQYVECKQLVRFRDHHYKLLSQVENAGINGDEVYDLAIKNVSWGLTMSISMTPGAEKQELEVPFIFVNDIVLLDQPGEWYFDVDTRELFYYPKSGENINNSQIIMPRLNRLISIESGNVNSKVKNIRFEGITFSHTNFDWATKEGFFTLQGSNTPIRNNAIGADRGTSKELDKRYMDAAVYADGAENITFQKNYFHLLGGIAIDIHNNSNNIDVLSNTIEDISGTGIKISSSFNMTIGDTSSDEGAVSNILISNNYVHKIGREFRGSIGIEYMYVENITVTHNEVNDAPYIGISSGYGWEGVFSDNSSTMVNAEISNNKIIGAMNLAKEGGSIYSLNRHNIAAGDTYGLVIKENYIKETTLGDYDRQAPVHNDEGSHNVLLEKNVISSPRPNFEWAHKTCKIDIKDNYVEQGRGTFILGSPRRSFCSREINVTNTTFIDSDDGLTTTDELEAQQIIDNAGIEQGNEPPNYTLSTKDDMLTKNSLFIYPNPISNKLNIRNKTSIKSIEIFNTMGSQVKAISNINKTSLRDINIENLSSGMYLIKIQDIEGKFYTSKFIKK